jgi:hypothetical protein
MGQGLAAALKDLQALLKEEASAKPSEDLASRKEAAVERLRVVLQSGESLDGDDGLAEQLMGLLAANRFSLKWNGLRARLGELSQPKTKAETPRPRLDLVH